MPVVSDSIATVLRPAMHDPDCQGPQNGAVPPVKGRRARRAFRGRAIVERHGATPAGLIPPPRFSARDRERRTEMTGLGAQRRMLPWSCERRQFVASTIQRRLV